MTQLALLSSPQHYDKKRALGQVFTPPGIVDFVLDQAGYGTTPESLKHLVLEPSCGEGAFLLGAARRISMSLRASLGARQMAAFRRRLAFELESRLWGVDVDPVAAGAAVDGVRRFFEAETGRSAAVRFFRNNVLVGDFLSESLMRDLRQRVGGPFGFVLGNPPYVATTELPADYKAALRVQFATASGRIDLYGLFMESGVRLLAPRGVLAFIVPDKFLQSQTARPLRRFLREEGSIQSIARFHSHKVFADAATVPFVFAFQRGVERQEFTSIECEYKNGTFPGRVLVNRSEELPTSRLSDDSWRTKPSDLEELASRLTLAHEPLGRLAKRISAGLATGRDSVFVVPSSVAAGLEPDLLRPAVRGRDLSALSLTSPHLSIIVPFKFGDHKPELVDIDRYPRTRAYLRSFQPELEARHCVRTWEKEWFDIHDPVSDDLARLAKILVPDVAATPRFVFDKGRYCPLHSAYYIVPNGIDGEYLAALLNSKPIEFLVRLRAPVVKDGFNRYRRQFLVDLPIPLPGKRAMERLVESARRRDFAAINMAAAKFFDLDSDDLRLIDACIEDSRHRRKERGGCDSAA